MKLLFTGDLHLDSRFSAEGDNAPLRARELIDNFEGMVELAKAEGVSAVLLAGDLFDTPHPSLQTCDALIRIFNNAPHIRFLIVCGNHDPLYKTPFYQSELAKNVYIFPSALTCFELDGAYIWGRSFGGHSENCHALPEGFKVPNPEAINILLLHVNLNKPDGGYMWLGSQQFESSGATMAALGHIHKRKSENFKNGRAIIYCSAPAGRGFDEVQETGFYILETDNEGGIKARYHPSTARKYIEYSCDISCAKGVEDILMAIRGCCKTNDEQNLKRVILTGAPTRPIAIDCEQLVGLAAVNGLLEIKDKTHLNTDYLAATSHNTLEGEFVRLMLNKRDKAPCHEHELYDIAIKEGVSALRGGGA